MKSLLAALLILLAYGITGSDGYEEAKAQEAFYASMEVQP